MSAETTPATKVMTKAEIRELEKNIQQALAAANGKIYGLDGDAAMLGMKPTTLASRIKALGVCPHLYPHLCACSPRPFLGERSWG